MVQRIALLIGGLGAAGVLAFALGFGNFIFAAPATNLAADNQPAPAADANVAAAPAAGPNKGTRNNAGDQNVQQPKPKTVIDKVYIAPTPAPKVVHVTPKTPNTQPSNPTTTTPAAPPAPATTPSYHEGNDHEGRNAQHNGRGRGDD